jgi:hypothetical protein
MRTDARTVEKLQSRVPGLSRSDYDYVVKKMRSRKLFPEVTDSEERANITRRLLAMEEPILTLYTLIRDIRYLKGSAALLRDLSPKVNVHKTLR